MDLRDRVVLVTGGARRIGRVTVLALADRGAKVVIHYSSSVDEAEATLREVEARGGEAMLLQADLMDEAAVGG